MNLFTLYYLFIHFIGDFVLQTSLMATKKSSSNYYLTIHIAVYTTVTIFGWWLLFFIVGIHISLLTYFIAYVAIFVMHWITDYLTSRVNTKLLPKKEEHSKDKGFFREIGGNIHNFFVSIGFDQWLHYVQIWFVLNYIIF